MWYVLYAKDDRYFTPIGTKNIKDLIELPCHCPICVAYTADELRKLSKDERIKAISEHNLYHSFSELKLIKQAIREGTLWDLVEQRVHYHPKLIKALKKCIEYPENFEIVINLNKKKGQKYLCSHSFHRAHIRRFRNKIKQLKFTQTKNKLICLPELDLPSKNGKSFPSWIKKIRSYSNNDQIQVGIMSNLMGFIPIELAEIFPAGQHEGVGNLIENPQQKSILLSDFEELLNEIINPSGENNETNLTLNIIFYMPDFCLNGGYG